MSEENLNTETNPAETNLEEHVFIDHENMKWYVVNTYSGYENKVKLAIEERIRQQSAEDFFGALLIPTETYTVVRDGVKRTSKRKFFPGYMIIQMEMNDMSWHLVKNTPKVSGFVGSSKNPPPLSKIEVDRLTKQITSGIEKPKVAIEFSIGDDIRVMEGPFENFNGTVEDVKADKQKVRVTVSIFGRATAVELDFGQVEKLS